MADSEILEPAGLPTTDRTAKLPVRVRQPEAEALLKLRRIVAGDQRAPLRWRAYSTRGRAVTQGQLLRPTDQCPTKITPISTPDSDSEGRREIKEYHSHV